MKNEKDLIVGCSFVFCNIRFIVMTTQKPTPYYYIAKL